MKQYIALRAEKIDLPDDVNTTPRYWESGCRVADLTLELQYDPMMGLYCEADESVKLIEIVGVRPL